MIVPVCLDFAARSFNQRLFDGVRCTHNIEESRTGLALYHRPVRVADGDTETRVQCVDVTIRYQYFLRQVGGRTDVFLINTTHDVFVTAAAGKENKPDRHDRHC